MEPPLALFQKRAPYVATVKSVERIVPGGETYHVVLDHGGNLPYWEGQCYGVIPPPADRKTKARTYSIASSRQGDHSDEKTANLCVKRAVSPDGDCNKNGVCSNFLCDSKPGDKLSIIGPLGGKMLLQGQSQIMVATGTGVAPFRGILRRKFKELGGSPPGGISWLFHGVVNKDNALYKQEFEELNKEFSERFRYNLALSEEELNKDGNRMRVQDLLEDHGIEVMELLEKPDTHIYFCGLKAMMPDIHLTMKRIVERRGGKWEEVLEALRTNKQWHEEVY